MKVSIAFVAALFKIGVILAQSESGVTVKKHIITVKEIIPSKPPKDNHQVTIQNNKQNQNDTNTETSTFSNLEDVEETKPNTIGEEFSEITTGHSRSEARREDKEGRTTTDENETESSSLETVSEESESERGETETTTVAKSMSHEKTEETESTAAEEVRKDRAVSKKLPSNIWAAISTIVDYFRSRLLKLPKFIFQTTFPTSTGLLHVKITIKKTSAPSSPQVILPEIISDTTNCSAETLPCSKEGFFRHNQSCTNFYKCFFSKKCDKLLSSPIYTCPGCLKFNAAKMQCDLTKNVPECTYFYSDGDEKKFCTGPGRFFVPDDCQRYYECVEDSDGRINLTTKLCPKSTVFDREEKECVKGASCPVYPECKTASPISRFVGDIFDCSKYYRCSGDNRVQPFNCGKGALFNGRLCELELISSFSDWEAVQNRLKI